MWVCFFIKQTAIKTVEKRELQWLYLKRKHQSQKRTCVVRTTLWRPIHTPNALNAVNLYARTMFAMLAVITIKKKLLSKKNPFKEGFHFE